MNPAPPDGVPGQPAGTQTPAVPQHWSQALRQVVRERGGDDELRPDGTPLCEWFSDTAITHDPEWNTELAGMPLPDFLTRLLRGGSGELRQLRLCATWLYANAGRCDSPDPTRLRLRHDRLTLTLTEHADGIRATATWGDTTLDAAEIPDTDD